jgi:hypothetical protein
LKKFCISWTGKGQFGSCSIRKKVHTNKKNNEFIETIKKEKKKMSYFTNDVLSGIISILSIPIDRGSFDKHGHGRSLGANVGVVLGPDETT